MALEHLDKLFYLAALATLDSVLAAPDLSLLVERLSQERKHVTAGEPR